MNEIKDETRNERKYERKNEIIKREVRKEREIIIPKKRLKIIPLGGLNEIGKNMTVFEYGDDIFVLDCGLAFPGDEMLGIDLVIPDVTYLVKNKDKIRGLVLTHGHEDHIGAIPYILKELNMPIYGTKLTLGLLEVKLEEHNLLKQTKRNIIKAGDVIQLGCFKLDIINTNHSIADSIALGIHTPIGTIVHTGDFKVDYTPIDGQIIDLGKFAELGRKGVLALMSDSTNAERTGYTMSESSIGKTIDEIFVNCDSRIIVATFASNIHRVQQFFNAAVKYGRKVAVCGRSMENVVSVAMKLGYMTIPDGVIIDVDTIDKYTADKLVIMTTGSQGEPMSALSRIASSEHKKVEIMPGDKVIISASPIPGNERLITKVINDLIKKGADVINNSLMDTHVSGHAAQEELKLILSLVKPKYFIPVHGEFKHLKAHAKIAQQLGIEPNNIFITDIGTIIELGHNYAKMTGTVQAGKVLVDGLGVGDVGNIVLRDRKILAEDGLIIVVVTINRSSGLVAAGPDIVSRGFVYVRESENLMDDVKTMLKAKLGEFESKHVTDWTTIKNGIRDELRDYLYEKTKRRPMILPILMEV